MGKAAKNFKKLENAKKHSKIQRLNKPTLKGIIPKADTVLRPPLKDLPVKEDIKEPEVGKSEQIKSSVNKPKPTTTKTKESINLKSKDTYFPKTKEDKVVSKQQKIDQSSLQKWFMVGVASSMVFKIFKHDNKKELTCWYYKLVKKFNTELKVAKFFLEDVNVKININNESDKEEIIAIEELADHNVVLTTSNGHKIMAEICISKKYIMSAINNYIKPALEKRK